MKKDCFRNTITISKTIFFYPNLSHQHQESVSSRISSSFSYSSFGIPISGLQSVFAIFHCSQLHSAFFRNEMFHSNGSSQISDSLTGNTFSSPGLSTVARKCARMPTAQISSAISRSFTCSVTPQSPLGRRNVLAARQNCRCARLRILEKFLQRFHDFHLSPVHTADRIAEAVHLIAVV